MFEVCEVAQINSKKLKWEYYFGINKQNHNFIASTSKKVAWSA